VRLLDSTARQQWLDKRLGQQACTDESDPLGRHLHAVRQRSQARGHAGQVAQRVCHTLRAVNADAVLPEEMPHLWQRIREVRRFDKRSAPVCS
jgi:hypothetical protein